VVTAVHQRTRCGRRKADPAAIGPEATPVGASVSSDRRAQDRSYTELSITSREGCCEGGWLADLIAMDTDEAWR
jgi:hypothetical protein